MKILIAATLLGLLAGCNNLPINSDPNIGKQFQARKNICGVSHQGAEFVFYFDDCNTLGSSTYWDRRISIPKGSIVTIQGTKTNVRNPKQSLITFEFINYYVVNFNGHEISVPPNRFSAGLKESEFFDVLN